MFVCVVLAVNHKDNLYILYLFIFFSFTQTIIMIITIIIRVLVVFKGKVARCKIHGPKPVTRFKSFNISRDVP